MAPKFRGEAVVHPPHNGTRRPGPGKPAPAGDRPADARARSNVIQYPPRGARSAGPKKQEDSHLRYPQKRPRRGTAQDDHDVEERQVVMAVLQGDVAAFRILVLRYQNPIYHLMMRLTKQTMTAEDLTQESFTRAYQKLGTFKPGKRFFPWLYTIAANIGRDYLRRQGRHNDLFSSQPLDPAWPDQDQDQCARRPDCVLALGQISDALALLPERYGETLLLYYREGMSAKEIAAALDISTAAVKVRIYRGRKLLKQKLGGNHENK